MIDDGLNNLSQTQRYSPKFFGSDMDYNSEGGYVTWYRHTADIDDYISRLGRSEKELDRAVERYRSVSMEVIKKSEQIDALSKEIARLKDVITHRNKIPKNLWVSTIKNMLFINKQHAVITIDGKTLTIDERTLTTKE